MNDTRWCDIRLEHHINRVWAKHGRWKCNCQRCKLEKYHLKKLYIAACTSVYPHEAHFAKVTLNAAVVNYGFKSVKLTKRGIKFYRGAVPKGTAPRMNQNAGLTRQS